MRLTQALIAIQTMADHSQKWHDKTTSKSIRSSSSNDGLAALVNKTSPDKDCPLNEEVKQVKEVRYGELRRTTPFNMNNGGRQIFAKTIKKYIEEASMRQFKGTSDDEDNIEEIIGYLEPTSYDGIQQLRGNYRGRLDSKSCGNFVESAAVTA
ncbi:hypothetical protein Tco_0435647 [Tanacetum coccineum]